MKKTNYRILLVGNPNAGKTTVFNSLAGMRCKVGNYSGVTVERKLGAFRMQDVTVEVEDLPGIYTLSASTAEERISRDAVAEGNFDLVVNVVDSSNFERNLFFTMQLAEMKVPMIIALNMTDELEKNGRYIDWKGLSAALGVPVIKCVGYSAQSAQRLKQFIIENIDACTLAHSPWAALESNILTEKMSLLAELLKSGLPENFSEAAEWMSVRVLENDPVVMGSLKEKTPHIFDAVKSVVADFEAAADEPPEMLVAAARYKIIDKVCMPFLKTRENKQVNVTRVLDSIFLNKYIGLPLFFALMYFVFEFVFALGDPLMNIMENGFATLSGWIAALWPEGEGEMAKAFVIDGIIGGVGAVFVFLPNIILLFLALSILEDSGYMARTAFLCDRVMKRFGLSGSSVIPMLIGFGCSVPAIIGTRTLKSKFERIATIMVIPLFSCGARFPVYVLLIPVFFPEHLRGAAMFAVYMTGILAALIVAKLLRMTALRGGESSFLIELPPYRLPRIRNVFEQVATRAGGFVKKAGTVILGMSIILWTLSTFPQKKEFSQDYDAAVAAVKADAALSTVAKTDAVAQLAAKKRGEEFDHTAMGRVGNFIEPAFRPLGFDGKIVSALLASLAAKEVFITQLGIIYGIGDNTEDDAPMLRQRLAVDYSPIQGMSILLFILLTAPCIATIGTTYTETKSAAIALGQFFGLGALAYAASLAFFQTASLFIHI